MFKIILFLFTVNILSVSMIKVPIPEQVNKISKLLPKYKSTIHRTHWINPTQKKLDYNKKLERTGLLNKYNRKKYLNYKEKLKIYKWSSYWSSNKKEKLKDLRIEFFNTAIVTEKENKVLLYSEKIRALKAQKIFSNIIKDIFILFNYNNLITKYIAYKYCECKITDNDIKKLTKKSNKEEKSIIVYIISKQFERIKDDFKEKHNFEMKISKYGEILDLNWNILGERIDKPKMKYKKKKK